MKRLLFLLLIFASVAFVSCKKETATCPYSESTVTASQAEKDSVQRYLVANNITGTTLHPSGFSYKITAPGSGTVTPGLCSYLSVRYSGYFFDGRLLDASGTSTINFSLGDLIVGWQKAIPLIKPGGSIDIYLPPSFAYGSADVVRNGVVVVPGNSYLKFTIELVAVQ